MTIDELKHLDQMAAEEVENARQARDYEAATYWETILETVGELLVLRATSWPCRWSPVIS